MASLSSSLNALFLQTVYRAKRPVDVTVGSCCISSKNFVFSFLYDSCQPQICSSVSQSCTLQTHTPASYHSHRLVPRQCDDQDIPKVTKCTPHHFRFSDAVMHEVTDRRTQVFFCK